MDKLGLAVVGVVDFFAALVPGVFTLAALVLGSTDEMQADVDRKHQAVLKQTAAHRSARAIAPIRFAPTTIRRAV